MSRIFEPVQLGSIESFCRAAEVGSFTAAAEALGITPAAVSRSVGRLETRLGVRLFARSTRSIRLTEDGRAYHEQCRQALAQIEDAERTITGRQAVASGLLRISVPTTYAHYRLMPVLPKFTARFPNIQLEINISNRNIDFIEEGYDLAIRLGVPQDSRLVARKLEDATLGVFAAPSYLRRKGTPKRLDDLEQHACIAFVMPSTGRALRWIFRDRAEDIELGFDSQVRVHEDVLGGLSYACAGGGLFQIYHFIAQGAVRRGELVEVLKPYAGRTRPFSILYPQNRHLSARLRALVDFLVREIESVAGAARTRPRG
jgi:DNA-binding transcriptional LysR family regulator